MFGAYRNPKPDPRDWKYSLAAAAFPDALTWLNIYKYPAKNQGGCGDCVGMSGADTMQAFAVINGSTPLVPALSGTGLYSEAQIASGQNPQNCDGTYISAALTAARTKGVPLDSFNCPPTQPLSPAAAADALKHTIGSYTNICYSGAPGIRDLIKAAIASRHPVWFGFDCSNTFRTTGTQPWPIKSGETWVGGHAVCGAGYDANWLYCIGSWGYITQKIAWDFIESSHFFDCYAVTQVVIAGSSQGPLPNPGDPPPPPPLKGTPVINMTVSLSGGNSPTGITTATANYPGDVNNNPVTLTEQFNPDGSKVQVPPASVVLIVGGTPSAGTKYSIEAVVTGSCDHVIFYVDDKGYHQENVAPWSIFGDSGGVLTTGKLGTGTHVVRADAYLKTTLVGTATITVIEP